MAAASVVAVPELAEMILHNLDVDNTLVASRAGNVFRKVIFGSLSLQRKLFLRAINTPRRSQWQYYTWNRRYPGLPNTRLWASRAEMVEKVRPRRPGDDFINKLTTTTPNSLLLRHTHQPEYYNQLAERKGVPQPEFYSLLVAIQVAHRRLHEPNAANKLSPGIDRLDITTKFFPAAMDIDSIWYDMFLFHELVPEVRVHYQLEDWQTYAGGQDWDDGFRISVTNSEGVRMRDVVKALKREYEGYEGTDFSGEWKVQISVEGTIFPTEGEFAMVEDGSEAELWRFRGI